MSKPYKKPFRFDMNKLGKKKQNIKLKIKLNIFMLILL